MHPWVDVELCVCVCVCPGRGREAQQAWHVYAGGKTGAPLLIRHTASSSGCRAHSAALLECEITVSSRQCCECNVHKHVPVCRWWDIMILLSSCVTKLVNSQQMLNQGKVWLMCNRIRWCIRYDIVIYIVWDSGYCYDQCWLFFCFFFLLFYFRSWIVVNCCYLLSLES